MTLNTFLIALDSVTSPSEGMDILFAAIQAVMSSYPGIIITFITSAYFAYRWYRKNHDA